MKLPFKNANRDDILAADDLQIEELAVPEWKLTVHVRGLTGVERDDWEAGRLDKKTKRKTGEPQGINHTNFRASLVVRTVCNDKGELLFGEKDIPVIGKKSAAAIERVFTVAMRLSGLTDEDIEELAEDLDDEVSADSSSS